MKRIALRESSKSTAEEETNYYRLFTKRIFVELRACTANVNPWWFGPLPSWFSMKRIVPRESSKSTAVKATSKYELCNESVIIELRTL
jgi:hypothetical protein